MKNNMRNNQGFTMVEILAVLLLIGILAAVAAPKFISLVKTARSKAAVAGNAECMSSLSAGYAKAYLEQGEQPTLAEVLTSSGLAAGDETFGDVVVNLTVGTTNVTILTVSVSDSTELDPVTNNWYLPSNN